MSIRTTRNGAAGGRVFQPAQVDGTATMRSVGGPEPRKQPMLLLRHASAGVRGLHPDVDRDRPLDDRGREQARQLPAHIRKLWGAQLGNARLLSSPFPRCVQTVAPLADMIGAEVVTDERLAEVPVAVRSQDGWPDAAWYAGRALAAIEDARTDTAPLIVCSHSEVLPALLALLAGREGRTLAAAIDLGSKALDKGAGWIVPTGSHAVECVSAPDT